MMITEQSLKYIDKHWAVIAVGNKDIALQQAEYRNVQEAVGQQIQLDEIENNTILIENVALAYELAAIEGLDELLRSGDANNLRAQAMAGAYRAYQLRRILPIPKEIDSAIFHILHLAALATCGDQLIDLRRWLRSKSINFPSPNEVGWDKRLLYRLFEGWVRLFRKDGWTDVEGIKAIIATLRLEQSQYEKEFLQGKEETQIKALRLIVLYHLAKATELSALFCLQGEPSRVEVELDRHFEAALKAAKSASDITLELLLRWLHAAARRMISLSIWSVAKRVNSRVTRFVEQVTRVRGMFELLPPQRAALLEQGLLDQAHRAIVIDMPTSGGKTALAQFRILQALNQFDLDKGWVAYVAPTRALVSQIKRRLTADFSPLGIQVEQLSGTVEINSFEAELLESEEKNFDILVTTPEKLQLVIRNKKVNRPLALIVMDEAHNIEDTQRGLRIELLLATIKRDCDKANFLLLMPYVPNAQDLADWLDGESGQSISLGTTVWQPNERIIGLFNLNKENLPKKGDWRLEFETLQTTPNTIHLKGKHLTGPIKPLNISASKASLSLQTAAIAHIFSTRGTSIAIARKIKDAWAMARQLDKELPHLNETELEDIRLVQRFLETEVSPNFELIHMLNKGIGVHHAGLPEEARTLIEWLTETGKLKVLCATTTVAQGLNFPVSSVFLASISQPKRKHSEDMNIRTFWNLAGRAGRINQESTGVVGIAAGKDQDKLKQFVLKAQEELISRLITLLDEVEKQGGLNNLTHSIQQEQWSDFRSYVAHLWVEKSELETVLAETETLLRSTYGYNLLKAKRQDDKANALLHATRDYAKKLAEHPENAILADSTGFSPEGVRTALLGLRQLEHKLKPLDWMPDSLFGQIGKSILPQLIGVMMSVPEIKHSLEDISGQGENFKRISEITHAWVMGTSIEQIARAYFSKGDDLTTAITEACKAINRSLTTAGPWGISALSKIPASGLNFEEMSYEQRRAINSLPAMIYHGVKSEAAILMRMNSIPRSIAEDLGETFKQRIHKDKQTIGEAKRFLKNLQEQDWNRCVPKDSKLSGQDYKRIWEKLSGESV